MSGHLQSHLQRIPAAEDKGADGLRPDCRSPGSGEGGWSLCGCQGGRGYSCLVFEGRTCSICSCLGWRV